MLPIYHKDGKPMIKAFDVHQFIPKSSPWAQQAPYVGGELAARTNMMPFTRGQFVPVVHTRIGHKGATYDQTVEGSKSESRQMYTRPEDHKASFEGSVFGSSSIADMIAAQTAAAGEAAHSAGQAAGEAVGQAVQPQKPWWEIAQEILGTAGEVAPGIIEAVQGGKKGSQPSYTTSNLTPSASSSQGGSKGGGISLWTIGLAVASLGVVGAVVYAAVASPKPPPAQESRRIGQRQVARTLNPRKRRKKSRRSRK